MRSLFLYILLGVAGFGCQKSQEKMPELGSHEISKVVSQMTDVMLHDVSNPPLATRFFSYASLAGYEVIVQNDPRFSSFKGKVNAYPDITKPKVEGPYSYQMSAVLAMIETAKKMQPSGKLLDGYEKKWLDSCQKAGFSEEVIRNSLEYAIQISKQILPYGKGDKYNKISNFPRYTPKMKEGYWYPTPPGYFAAVEPYFFTVRSFNLDSSSQFKPVPPVPFSNQKGSAFYKLVEEVYHQKLPQEHREIAAFWDCNPFALQDNGHLMVGMKKISPGAHWMGIAGIACDQAKFSLEQSMQVYATLSMSLMDAFIICWDEKYRSDRVRPETAIRKFIDPRWRPMLQTPPFPEYLSGHSTISSTASVILTHFFGENFKYTDIVEVRFGLKARSFSSFRHAAEEAAISRLYGGIHFTDAIDNGMKQGFILGDHIVGRLFKDNSKNTVAMKTPN